MFCMLQHISSLLVVWGSVLKRGFHVIFKMISSKEFESLWIEIDCYPYINYLVCAILYYSQVVNLRILPSTFIQRILILAGKSKL